MELCVETTGKPICHLRVPIYVNDSQMRVVEARIEGLSVSRCPRKVARLLWSFNKNKHRSGRQRCVAPDTETKMGKSEHFVSRLTSKVISIVGWRADIAFNPDQSRNRWLLTWHQPLSGSCGRNSRWGSGLEVEAAHSSNVGTNKATLSASEVSFTSP